MKFFNVALALALVLAPDTAFATNESNIFNAEPTFPHQDGLEETVSTASSKGTRYLVKYNDNSPKFNTRLETARIQAQANKQDGKDLNGAVPSFSADTHLLTHGSFLPNQNVEIVYFNSEEEKTLFGQSKEVEYIEEDSLFYMNAEEIPYGIDTVKAFAVSDDNVSNRKVCILDTGYDITHPDLTSDTAVVTGYTGSNSAGPSPWTYDGHGHGTHVAGTIAAIGSNDKGVVGVNRNGQLKLHIVKVFGDSGTWGWQSTLIAAGEECVKANANVISMSLGSSTFSQAASDAYDRMLNDDDILIVAAAGNGGKNAAKSYPASYESVMSVAATDSNDNVASFSQENDQVDIAAPGVSVLSTLPLHVASSGYRAWSGTSMATPHVSGVAALVWSHHPTKSAVEIREALEVSAVDMGALGRDNAYGHGLLRADLAMEFLGGSPSISPSPTDAPTVSFSERPSVISSSPTTTPTISSSPTMESDYEDHQVIVGSSNGQISKSVELPFDNMLAFPQPINRRDFSPSYTQFSAEVEGKILTITKTNPSSAWSQNFIARLVKVANSSSWKEFRVGPSENVGSNSNPFYVELPEENMRVIPYPSNSMHAWWADTFDVEVTGKTLKVTRTDKDGTWGMNLHFYIAPGRDSPTSPPNPLPSSSPIESPSTKSPIVSPSSSPTSSPIVSPSSSPVEACSEEPSTSFFFKWNQKELTKKCLWLATRATTRQRKAACALKINSVNDSPVASVACPETCDTCPKGPSSQPSPSPTISFAPSVQGDCSQNGSSRYLNFVNNNGIKSWKTCNQLSAMTQGKINKICARDYKDGNEAMYVCRVACGTCPSECELRVMELEELNADLQKRIDDLEK